ncbi:accessory factor UbiK family protein [Larsenimonas rhizosphaerae]|uniref:Ubiquinone biosynthesis accessory factor UbiK n=1 Tax=Larsenimonas rhizosphaerae TaxID=2944682 RepID=A0AA42CU19_9GAMM|nr:accessory factor UbiK family protein [Larsenimonas rhizosphaerae]MCM2129526.1 accessory factor UbiK family protein [Larsenimonas rhizosphaerae]MCX2524182.1 accessory factor UbiK family protein [Larsenimonas rhizosphaerae]
MANRDVFSRFAQQLGDRLQDVSHAPEDIQRSVQSAMKSTFDRFDLVSREDFDIMMDVLQRTRSRVEALEQQVASMESQLDSLRGKTTTTANAEAKSDLGEDTSAAPESGSPGAA